MQEPGQGFLCCLALLDSIEDSFDAWNIKKYIYFIVDKTLSPVDSSDTPLASYDIVPEKPG